jgi:hypothetical protein
LRRAVTVTLWDGKNVVRDGPFTEAKEMLGGYTLLEAESREDAIRMAQGFFGKENPLRVSIEVREVAALQEQAARM